VAGAGPAGLALALQAHDHGATVRIVDRRPEAVRPSRALILHARTLEVLRPIGVTSALPARADTAPAADLRLGGRAVRVTFGDLALPDTAFSHLTLVRQMEVERVLAGALADRGVETGDWTDATVIILVIVVNTTAGVIQEVKADHAISALTQLTAPDARVIRDGAQQQIPAADMVTGDLIVLAEGDIVPADAQVTEAAALLVDESALTGESVPVDKAAGADVVSSGTVVVRGRGYAVVTATGTASAMGRVAALMTARSALTPLQHRMIEVGRALAVAAVALCAIVLAVGLARGQGTELMVITAISLVVAAVPESLPAVVTLALAWARGG
jgi:magnesium-transporting ATPase (P-type)